MLNSKDGIELGRYSYSEDACHFHSGDARETGCGSEKKYVPTAPDLYIMCMAGNSPPHGTTAESSDPICL